MQSFYLISFVLAIVCGLAAAASPVSTCSKPACEILDKTLGETRIIPRASCQPDKKWCCPPTAFKPGVKSISVPEASVAHCKPVPQ
ncbi:hypothetical protein MJO28_008705 [Puccinia striiformis f. sp. tritici]|uniref:Uncharacterized protein n=4 Tax=Puccinia striiformis TaxID=27350 RepID=A0A0L0W2C3_9BASI|nr:hypothetical protein Pst134EB_016362 [Puccinia striiformis f. sp. tritici]KNF05622.1 hypothetical protein PSTG_01431 [Puccinia striiformis f. sp. tritici PST-78]POW16828.1 hypothetical protein PSTT_00950 [Puccinia striiformis]KAI7949884.1 hypothetical protein MJO28_008705 [Puccinia striiformis f. sp. tritici]KNF05623.1 hypothetical protein, variant [Puccinia striiformis f. sp. tritici PST-78]